MMKINCYADLENLYHRTDIEQFVEDQYIAFIAPLFIEKKKGGGGWWLYVFSRS